MGIFNCNQCGSPFAMCSPFISQNIIMTQCKSCCYKNCNFAEYNAHIMDDVYYESKTEDLTPENIDQLIGYIRLKRLQSSSNIA